MGQTLEVHFLSALVPVILLVSAGSPSTGPVPELAWELVSRRPHDTAAFTQGLELDTAGRLFESTGIEGRSTIREVDATNGMVLRQRALPDEHFGEGITLVGDRLIGLTYTSGVATSYDLETFEPLATYEYDGQGWGLCYDGQRLVMSDGGPELTFRDPATFERIGTVTVTLDGEPVTRLNELECVDHVVWANVWKRDVILRVDPERGAVTGFLDLAGVIDPYPPHVDSDAVLNGIAWDARAGTFLVTGKLWPELVEIRILEPDVAEGLPVSRVRTHLPGAAHA